MTETMSKIEPVKIPEGFDIKAIRSDFPILDSMVGEAGEEKKLVYLDSGATAQKPVQVIERMRDFMLHENGTVRRGVYYLSTKSTKAFDATREKVRDFINAEKLEEIIFTRGTTESINLVAYSFGETFISEGDEIIISSIEHHANIVPWQLMAERKGAKLKVIPSNDKGELDLSAFKSMLNPKVKIVSVIHVSNALGTVVPVKEICSIAHEQNIPVLVDGAQAIQHEDVDVQDIDADFYVFSGHKLYGPTGIGVLYGRKSLLEKMVPYHGGGEMIDKVTFEKTTFGQLPFKFEAGTPAIAEGVGLGEAIDYVNRIGLDKIKAYEQELLRYATQKAQQLEGLRIIGTADNKASILSFVFDDVEAFDIGTILNTFGVAIRVGHHCAQPVMDKYGVFATARVSLAFYNTQDDIDRFFEALEETLKIFRG